LKKERPFEQSETEATLEARRERIRNILIIYAVKLEII
jgi:hypothetical protein